MHINTFLLILVVIGSYLNLYLTYKRIQKPKITTKLPISSKEWNEKVEEEKFKSWLSNRKKLRDRRKKN